VVTVKAANAAFQLVLAVAFCLSIVEAQSQKVAPGWSAQKLTELKATPEWDAAYSNTAPLWQKLSAARKIATGALPPAQIDLRPKSEEFFRTFVASVRLTGRIKEFGAQFERLLDERPQVAGCAEFLLCQAAVSRGFIVSKPPSTMDIARYLLEHTCFGFLPDRDNRLLALKILDASVATVGAKDLANEMKSNFNDLNFLHHSLADVLAAAKKEWKAEARYAFYNLYKLIRLTPGDGGKNARASGRDRSLFPADIDALRAACA
jgi:hypothetical protein